MGGNLFDNLNKALAKLFAGIELTSLYLFSLGTAYPPINEDVTFWCVQPYVSEVRRCKRHVFVYTISFNFSSGKELVQTYLGDPDIQSKIDFEIRTNFLIHGWMSGLDGGNRYLPADVRQSDGRQLIDSDYWHNIQSICRLDAFDIIYLVANGELQCLFSRLEPFDQL